MRLPVALAVLLFQGDGTFDHRLDQRVKPGDDRTSEQPGDHRGFQNRSKRPHDPALTSSALGVPTTCGLVAGEARRVPGVMDQLVKVRVKG